LLASHRHVFGVLLWYVLLPGPSGAILYRLAAFLAARWQGLGAFGRFAQQAFYVLDWPAVRLTAAAFAVVGDFEDAVYCWRTQAAVMKAPALEAFGTVVDWLGAVIREGERLAKEKGLRVDWPKFADAWRAGYHPAMDRVRKGKLPWTHIDQLHRMILNDLLKP